MKKQDSLEPGLMHTFRRLTWLEFFIMLISSVSFLIHQGFDSFRLSHIWVIPFDLVLVLLILYWDWFQVKFNKVYFQLALILSSLGPILRFYYTTLLRVNPQLNFLLILNAPNRNITIPLDFININFLLTSWQLLSILFRPLILVAWQYHFKQVIIYCFTTALFDAATGLLVTYQYGIPILGLLAVIFIRTASFLLVGYLVTNMMQEQRKQHADLNNANQRLIGYAATLEQLTISRERNRLSRELHDTVAHTLSALAVQLEAVRSLWQHNSSGAKLKLEESIQTTRAGLTETRRSFQALRASPLEDLGLCLALKELATTAAERCGAALTLDLPQTVTNITSDKAQAIYRIAQEVLENIVRHAGATQINVSLQQKENLLTLEITDDGQGFDLSKVDTDASFGLRGLQERAELVGGQCTIQSLVNSGTSIIFTVGA